MSATPEKLKSYLSGKWMRGEGVETSRVDPAIATAHTGHGIVMPQCNHGGPGRAGAGEELGGLHGLRFYHQLLAVQGSSDLLASLQAGAASIH